MKLEQVENIRHLNRSITLYVALILFAFVIIRGVWSGQLELDKAREMSYNFLSLITGYCFGKKSSIDKPSKI